MAIATIETVLGRKVVAVDDQGGACEACYFASRPRCEEDGILCLATNRPDKRSVFFVKLEETGDEQSNN